MIQIKYAVWGIIVILVLSVSGCGTVQETPISALPKTVQGVLKAEPRDFQNDISYCVKNWLTYSTWGGNSRVPGTFKLTHGSHGVIVYWTLLAKENMSGPAEGGTVYWNKGKKITFEFEVSNNGHHIQFVNRAAQVIENLYT